MKPARLLTSLTLIVLGVLLGLYGLFALSFREGDSSTYVTLGAHRLNADVVGGLSLALGLAALGAAVVGLRRRRTRAPHAGRR